MSQRTGYSRNVSDSEDEEDTQQPLAISPKKTPKSKKKEQRSHIVKLLGPKGAR